MSSYPRTMKQVQVERENAFEDADDTSHCYTQTIGETSSTHGLLLAMERRKEMGGYLFLPDLSHSILTMISPHPTMQRNCHVL